MPLRLCIFSNKAFLLFVVKENFSLSDEEIEKIKDENDRFFELGKYAVKNVPEGF